MSIDAVVIGASAGGIEALAALLPALPSGYPLPVAIVVHLPPERRSFLVEVFSHRCVLEMREAEDKEEVRAGVVYFAPPDYHLLFEDRRSFSLSVDDLVNHSRPSIDVLFESAALAFGPRLLGVVLSGANADGAQGIRAICNAGGKAAVQDPDTALAREMPKAALAACRTARIVTLQEMKSLLLHAGGPR
jgi:two-component system chemotaxis response regulator CheB